MAEEAAVQAVSDSQSSSVVYDSEEETLKDYRPGGYHPVRLNDLFLNRYVIKQKLGWGHFSTVWLCLDTKFDTYVAMKVQKSAPNYTEAAYDEIDILLKVAGNFKSEKWLESLRKYNPTSEDQAALQDANNAVGYTFVVQFLNSFVHIGENGKHVCMVFEILGVNLLEIIKRFNYKGIPIPICRVISKQVLVGLDYLHRICGIIHTDLKPENVLLELTQQQIREILFPGQCFPEPTSTETPITELPLAMPSDSSAAVSEEQKKEEEKKQKKREKKKKYKQRKKEEAKKLKEENPVDPAKPKKRKRKKKNKNSEVPILVEPTPQEPPSRPDEPSDAAELEKHDAERGSSSGSEGRPKRYRSNPLKSLEPVTETIRVKIADLGNACWLDQHFSTEIQTRQYRSPEVILGISYNATADLWSFACMLFELITGDFLFEPKSGSDFDKDDDHLGQMIETLGEFPLSFALSGLSSKKFFTKSGRLRNIHQLRYWKLRDVLVEKYRLRPREADSLTSFLLPMLTYRPENRATAEQILSHPWLSEPPNYDCKMTEEEVEAYDQAQADLLQRRRDNIMLGVDCESSPELSHRSEEEDRDADDELEAEEEDEASGTEELPEVADLVKSSEYHEKMKSLKQDMGLNRVMSD